jgi:hypothetical protein
MVALLVGSPAVIRQGLPVRTLKYVAVDHSSPVFVKCVTRMGFLASSSRLKFPSRKTGARTKSYGVQKSSLALNFRYDLGSSTGPNQIRPRLQ